MVDMSADVFGLDVAFASGATHVPDGGGVRQVPRPNVEVQVESTGSQGRIEQREFMGRVLYYHQDRFGVGD